jgi:hypothetical protein
VGRKRWNLPDGKGEILMNNEFNANINLKNSYMKKYYRLFFFAGCFKFNYSTCFFQTSISIYNSSHSKVGLAYEKNNSLSFHIEFQPTIDSDDGIIYRSSVGIRYRIGKSKDNLILDK